MRKAVLRFAELHAETVDYIERALDAAERRGMERCVEALREMAQDVRREPHTRVAMALSADKLRSLAKEKR